VNTVWEHSLCEHSMCDHSMWALYVWPLYMRTPKSTKLTRKNEHQFLGRMWNTKTHKTRELARKLDFSSWAGCCSAKKTSKKHEFYCKNTVQEHWRTPKSTRITTKNEHWRISKGIKLRKFTDETRFRPFQEHRRPPESTRITTKNEHRRSWRAGNYENLQTKPVAVGRGHPKTTKIHTRNEHASTKPRK